MIPLIGYVDRLSARPGDTLEFKVNSAASEPFSAELIKIVCADPNPDGPGIIHEKIASTLDGTYPSRRQDYALGSYIRIGQGEKIATLTSFTVIATIWPTAPMAGRQGIVDCFDEERDSGFSICIDEQGCTSVTLGTGKEEASYDNHRDPAERTAVVPRVGVFRRTDRQSGGRADGA